MPRKPSSRFTRFAQSVAVHAGRPIAFGFAAGFLIAWLVVGPLMEYHPLWQQLFGFVTGVITFLMVFLIQNTQNRDTEAIHIKLDELLRATKGARIDLSDAEDLDDEELDRLHAYYEELADKARQRRKK
ncbi:MAG TPA: low affinity iron permease family protein [Chthoniobacteraceae bacterium]|nr:low affinity iron permease family protein [Chthoniobacteraceae bacterium]